MDTFRRFLVCCLIAAVPTTGLAGALDFGHCAMKDESQGQMAEMDHSMHAGHAMDHDGSDRTPATDDRAKVGKPGCQCGCDCSNDHCTSSFLGFLSPAAAGQPFAGIAVAHVLSSLTAHLAAAHHLDLLRPPIPA